MSSELVNVVNTPAPVSKWVRGSHAESFPHGHGQRFGLGYTVCQQHAKVLENNGTFKMSADSVSNIHQYTICRETDVRKNSMVLAIL